MENKKHSSRNLNVIENYILHLTHCSSPKDFINNEEDVNYKEEQTYTPKIMYDLAKMYIEEDHVDGMDNPDDNIVKFSAESSFDFEDKEKKYPEQIIIMANYGNEMGTESVISINGMENMVNIKKLIKLMQQ